METIIRKNPKLGNYLHYLHQAEARHAGYEQVLVGYQPIQTGVDEETGEPILGDGDPIYENGDDLFSADWDEAWGEPPTDEELEAWEEPEPELNPVTDVEIAKREAKKNYLERREIRQANIDKLMVDVAFAMVAEGSFTVDNVDEEGSEFIAAHGGHIYRYVMGGNKTAQDLYDAIVASKNAEASARAFPWLSNAILAIFSKALLGR